MSSTVVIFIELPDLHWHFDSVLNASVMVIQATMRVYMFHGRESFALVMSPFFHPHQPFDNITLDDIRPYFPPLRYPINGESDSDTCLTPTISLDSDPLEPSYPSYHVEIDQSKPSYPSVIRLTSDSSSSAASHHVPPPIRACEFIHTRALPHGHGCARGRRRGDVSLEGFRNSFLPPDE